MHWLWQLLHNWWAALGIGAILGDGIKRLGAPVIEFLLDGYDQAVWDVVKVPRYSPLQNMPVVGGWAQPAPIPIPYTTKEIIAKVGRSEFFVSTSLKRLEKRGKVRETHEGWLCS